MVPLQKTWRTLAGVSVAFCALAAIAGCGEKKFPIRGKVIFADGTPVPSGLVVLSPVDPASRVGARGYIQTDGSFELSTDKEGDGVLPGKFKVLVHGPNAGREDAPVRNPQVHPKYLSFDTSGLDLEVKPGKNDDITFKVERAPKK